MQRLGAWTMNLNLYRLTPVGAIAMGNLVLVGVSLLLARSCPWAHPLLMLLLLPLGLWAYANTSTGPQTSMLFWASVTTVANAYLWGVIGLGLFRGVRFLSDRCHTRRKRDEQKEREHPTTT
jgi:hypothetical protein